MEKFDLNITTAEEMARDRPDPWSCRDLCIRKASMPSIHTLNAIFIVIEFILLKGFYVHQYVHTITGSAAFCRYAEFLILRWISVSYQCFECSFAIHSFHSFGFYVLSDYFIVCINIIFIYAYYIVLEFVVVFSFSVTEWMWILSSEIRSKILKCQKHVKLEFACIILRHEATISFTV